MIDYEHATKQAARQKKTSRATLVGLFVLFAAPVIAAWVLFFLGESWWPKDMMNRGELVQPARELSLSGLTDVEGQAMSAEFLQHKWTLIFVETSACGQACLKRLYLNRQVRLTQGKYLDRLAIAFLLADGGVPADFDKWSDKFPGMTVGLMPAGSSIIDEFRVAPAAADDVLGRTYLVDPRGFLMMRYQVDQDPKDKISDLKRLLKVSAIR